jgi:hypothetical protein
MEDNIKNLTMFGAKVSFYDDGQYKLGGMFIQVDNTFDLKDMNNHNLGFETKGGLFVTDLYASIKGIGDEYNDFFDETILFASFGLTRTDPDSGKSMLGSSKSEVGTSYLLGAQFPSIFSKKGKMGVEFNHGSKYFRPLTYGEDTLIGSKTAVRGNVWEFYVTEPLVDKLTFQVRYTMAKYDYSGSNGFFGDTGTPMTMNEAVAAGMGDQVVSSATNIRAYLRYEF